MFYSHLFFLASFFVLLAKHLGCIYKQKIRKAEKSPACISKRLSLQRAGIHSHLVHTAKIDQIRTQSISELCWYLPSSLAKDKQDIIWDGSDICFFLWYRQYWGGLADVCLERIKLVLNIFQLWGFLLLGNSPDPFSLALVQLLKRLWFSQQATHPQDSTVYCKI